MPTTSAPRPTPAQTRALLSATTDPNGYVPATTAPRTMGVLRRNGWVGALGEITDEGRTAIGEPTTAAVTAAAERGEENRAAHTPGCRSWIDGDAYCDCAPITPATVVVGERPAGVTRGPAWRLSGGTPIVAQEAPEESTAEESTDEGAVCLSCGQRVTPWTNHKGVTLLVADDQWGGICGDAPTGEHTVADDSLPVDDYSTPRTMVEYSGLVGTEQGAEGVTRGRVGFAPVWAVVVLVATVLGFLVNVGPGGSVLVAHAASSAPLASPVSAPAVAGAPVGRCEEDQPCWSCSTMGNRVCGYGTAGGPVGTTARGVLDVWCPAGGSPVDLSGDAPLLPSSDVRVLLRTVGCRYGARESIMGGVPAHPNGVIHASGIDSRPIHASVYPMTSTQSPTPRADAREAARRAATRPGLVAWEDLTGDEDPAVIDAVCRAATNEARALLRPAP